MKQSLNSLISNKIILGTVQFGLNYGINNNSGKPEPDLVYDILKTAYDNGILYLDTANAYGDAIALIGEFHAKYPTVKFNVISKFHLQDINELSIKEELIRLQTDRFYAYLFHSFSDYETANETIFASLEKVKKNGLIGRVGVSIYTNEQFLKAINDDRIELIQFPYNLLDNWSQKGELIKMAKAKGKETHCRSVFLQGLFYKNESDFPDQLKPLIPGIRQIKELARRNRCSINNFALSYALNNPYIDHVLIGVDSKKQLLDNLLYHPDTDFSKEIEKFNNINTIYTELLNPSNWKKS